MTEEPWRQEVCGNCFMPFAAFAGAIFCDMCTDVWREVFPLAFDLDRVRMLRKRTENGPRMPPRFPAATTQGDPE